MPAVQASDAQVKHRIFFTPSGRRKSAPFDLKGASRLLGIVDVGGGLRGAFGAGVFDYCLEKGIAFPYCIGVSAGSSNISSYLAGQKGRNVAFYAVYPQRKEYMSARNLLLRGSYIDLEYVYGTLSNSGGEDPLDFPAILKNPARFRIVATDAETGKPVYFDKTDMRQDAYEAVKASSCLPGICKPWRIDGKPYYDGGISDPIPFARALDDGCDRVVIILTRPRDYRRVQGKDRYFAHLVRRYPASAAALLKRWEVYNRELEEALALEKASRALILAPDDVSGIGTLSRDPQPIKALYEKGIKAGELLNGFI